MRLNMAMFKQAASLAEDVVSFPIRMENDSDVVLYQPTPNEEEVVELEMTEPSEHVIELSFDLPTLPGAPDECLEVSGDEIELNDESEEEEGQEEAKASDKKEKGDKDWQSLSKKDFLAWMKDYLSKIPKHKGETIALERAMSYLKRGLDILSKSVQQDFDGEIDISKAEDARVEMESGIDRLDKELQRRRKKAAEERGLTKEATAPYIGGIVVTVPLIVSSIARTCINSNVSAGKDIEQSFNRLAEKFKLNDREKLEVVQFLSDMGYPMRRDMGFGVDDKEQYGYSSENNYNYAPNYWS